MTLTLPKSVATFFEVSNGAPGTHLTHLFAADAVVVDEGGTHQGHEAIRSWLCGTRKKFAYRVEPLSVSEDGDRMTVAALVTGDFPGSPAHLEHVFQLVDGKIQSLEIR